MISHHSRKQLIKYCTIWYYFLTRSHFPVGEIQKPDEEGCSRVGFHRVARALKTTASSPTPPRALPYPPLCITANTCHLQNEEVGFQQPEKHRQLMQWTLDWEYITYDLHCYYLSHRHVALFSGTAGMNTLTIKHNFDMSRNPHLLILPVGDPRVHFL